MHIFSYTKLRRFSTLWTNLGKCGKGEGMLFLAKRQSRIPFYVDVLDDALRLESPITMTLYFG